MKFQYDISIRSKLNALLAVITIIILAMGIFTYISINNIVTYTNYQTEVEKLSALFETLRKHENSFLNKYRNDNDFFEKGESTELEKHQKTSTNISQTLTNLQSNKLAKSFEINDYLDELKINIENYNESFKQLVDKLKLKGYKNYGIIGSMREDIKGAEVLSDDLKYQNLLLTLRRHEKDYLLRNDLIYFEKSKKIIEETQNYVKLDSTLYNIAIITALENYKTNLQQVINITTEIGHNENEGLRLKLNTETQKLEPIITNINNSIQEDIANTKNNLITAIIIFIIVVILVITISIFKVFNTIMRPVIKLKGYIQKLGKGVLPESFIEFQNKDEIYEMGEEIKKLTSGFQKTTEFAIAIGEGKMDTQFTPMSKEDTLGNALLEMQTSLKKTYEENAIRKKEEDKQNWATNGLATLGDILRKDNDNMEQLAYNIISNLVKYVDANQGVMYTLNDDEKDDMYYELKATFAYGKRKHKSKRLELGEGIAGRCAQEKETIYMIDVPESYVFISSGIGAAKPRNILVVPLKLIDDVYGIIEIASFNLLEEYQIKFIEKAAENIASTISSVRINIRTAQLLKESKIQAEELASKEEEMRQNMEELQATQEEAARKEAEASGFVNSVNHTIIRADFSNEGYLIYANSKFLDLLEYTTEEVENQHISIFIDENEKADFEEKWLRVINGGKHIEQEMRQNTKNGKVWMLSTYTGIKDNEGNVQKILFLAIDINDQKIKNLNFEGELNAIERSIVKAEYTPEGKMISANDMFLSTLGYKKEEITESDIFSYMKDEDAQKFEYAWKQIAKGLPHEGQVCRLNKRGKERWFQGAYSPVRDFDNNIYKIVYIAYDITKQKRKEAENRELLKESKRQEEELRNRETELRQNMDQLNATQEQMANNEAIMASQLNAINETNAFVEYNLDGTIISVNSILCQLFGYEKEDLIGRNHEIFVDQETKISEEYQQIWEGLRKGEVQKGEYKRIGKDGQTIYLKAVYNLILTKEGTPDKVMMLGFDITDAKISEVEIKGQLEAINHITPFIEYSPEGIIINANQLFCNLFGYELDELIGQHHKIFIDIESRESEGYKKFWENLNNGKYQEGEYRRIKKDGKVLFNKSISYPVTDSDGNTLKIISLEIDITQFKLQEQKLTELTKKIQEQDLQMKESMKSLRVALEATKKKELQIVEENKQLLASYEELQQTIETMKKNEEQIEQIKKDEIKKLSKNYTEKIQKLEQEIEEYKRTEKNLIDKIKDLEKKIGK